MTKSRISLVVIVGLVLAGSFSGCAQAVRTRPEGWQRIPSTARVVLMTPDIELSEISAGGVAEPKAEWTERAKRHVVEALRTEIGAKNANLVVYEPPASDPAREYQHNQLIKLHDVVGRTVLVHHYGAVKLPNKDGKFDWSLGSGASVLKDDQDADYALFVFLRDSYASAGRKAAMVGWRSSASPCPGACSSASPRSWISGRAISSGSTGWWTRTATCAIPILHARR